MISLINVVVINLDILTYTYRSTVRYALDENHDDLFDATLSFLNTIEDGRTELFLHHFNEIEQQTLGESSSAKISGLFGNRPTRYDSKTQYLTPGSLYGHGLS
jgi:hypothetical protein